MKARLLIPAAGLGARLGCRGPKALVELAGKPMLARTLERFAPLGLDTDAIIIVPPGQRPIFENALRSHFPHHEFLFIDGGAERQESVCAGLSALEADTEIAVIHDAARPFVAAESAQASIDGAAERGAATVAIPSSDTILVADENLELAETPDRRRLWACQTPQTFRVDVIRRAHAVARERGFVGTDDATVVRMSGARVKLVMGTPLNFKITAPQDLALAEQVIRGGLI